MKTVHKIDPEKEYETAKGLIEVAKKDILDTQIASSLEQSVDKLMLATRILLEREDRRRGATSKEPKENAPKGRQKGQEREDADKSPSKRNPELPVETKDLTPLTLPSCPCCGNPMKPSGLFAYSEKLETSPNQLLKTY